jgi:methyltransferase-like protein/SAM-dependent methyltransferase
MPIRARARRGGAVDEAVEQVRADYDAAPYESHAHPESAPGRLAAIAHLFGLDTPDIATARVIELGCAAGGNLIPFVATHPGACAVGIDLSEVQIAQGRDMVAALGLDNLELKVGDITALDLAELGKFDFVILHGVYSWVPEHVQEAILPAIHTLLAPRGVAYVSYNVYPGWKSKEIVRDAMMLFGANLTTPDERVSHARGLIELLDDVAPNGGILSKSLKDYQAFGGRAGDYYLLHEELETFNRPCYFMEFLGLAGSHSLAYLAEARPQSMFAGNYGDEVAARLLEESGQSQVLLEQYLDFVVNRTFRQTLLIPGERASQVRYQVDRTRWEVMHFAASVPPLDGGTRLDESSQSYGASGEVPLVTDDPVVKAAVDEFNARWPWTVTRQELLDSVTARIGIAGFDATEAEKRIDDLLEHLIFRRQALYRLEPLRPELLASAKRPRIDEMSRRMAELTQGEVDAFTFNRWHETVFLDPVDRYLVPLLDGTRDRAALLKALVTVARDGHIWFQQDGKRVRDKVSLRDALAELLDGLPDRLAKLKLT